MPSADQRHPARPRWDAPRRNGGRAPGPQKARGHPPKRSAVRPPQKAPPPKGRPFGGHPQKAGTPQKGHPQKAGAPQKATLKRPGAARACLIGHIRQVYPPPPRPPAHSRRSPVSRAGPGAQDRQVRAVRRAPVARAAPAAVRAFRRAARGLRRRRAGSFEWRLAGRLGRRERESFHEAAANEGFNKALYGLIKLYMV